MARKKHRDRSGSKPCTRHEITANRDLRHHSRRVNGVLRSASVLGVGGWEGGMAGIGEG